MWLEHLLSGEDMNLKREETGWEFFSGLDLSALLYKKKDRHRSRVALRLDLKKKGQGNMYSPIAQLVRALH